MFITEHSRHFFIKTRVHMVNHQHNQWSRPRLEVTCRPWWMSTLTRRLSNLHVLGCIRPTEFIYDNVFQWAGLVRKIQHAICELHITLILSSAPGRWSPGRGLARLPMNLLDLNLPRFNFRTNLGFSTTVGKGNLKFWCGQQIRFRLYPRVVPIAVY